MRRKKIVFSWFIALSILGVFLLLLHWDDQVREGENKREFLIQKDQDGSLSLQRVQLNLKSSQSLVLKSEDAEEIWKIFSKIKVLKRFHIKETRNASDYGVTSGSWRIQFHFNSGEKLALSLGEKTTATFGVYATLDSDPHTIYIISQHVLLVLDRVQNNYQPNAKEQLIPKAQGLVSGK